jgi:hypothetical protein
VSNKVLELQQECGFVNTPKKSEKAEKAVDKKSPSTRILDVQKQLSSQKGFLKVSPKKEEATRPQSVKAEPTPRPAATPQSVKYIFNIVVTF